MLNVIPTDDTNRFDVIPGKAWTQGFATFGGYVAASALRAATLAGHDRLLLSAQVNYLAPLPVEGYSVSIDALRVGKGTSVVEARVTCPNPKDPGAAPILSAQIVFTYGVPRPTSVGVTSCLDPSQLTQFAEQANQDPNMPMLPGVPPFLHQFDFKPLVGARPFEGLDSVEHAWTIRPKQPLEMSAQEYALLMSDTNPPPVISLVDKVTPGSTLSWFVSFEHPQPSNVADGWIYVLMHQDSAAESFGSHATALFDAQGRHLTSNRQITAFFELEVTAPNSKTIARQFKFAGNDDSA